jgi:hypothetical protein
MRRSAAHKQWLGDEDVQVLFSCSRHIPFVLVGSGYGAQQQIGKNLFQLPLFVGRNLNRRGFRQRQI